jgi:hypothetical protein
MGKFHHDQTLRPKPGNHGLGFGKASPNGRTIQVPFRPKPPRGKGGVSFESRLGHGILGILGFAHPHVGTYSNLRYYIILYETKYKGQCTGIWGSIKQ